MAQGGAAALVDSGCPLLCSVNSPQIQFERMLCEAPLSSSVGFCIQFILNSSLAHLFLVDIPSSLRIAFQKALFVHGRRLDVKLTKGSACLCHKHCSLGDPSGQGPHALMVWTHPGPELPLDTHRQPRGPGGTAKPPLL